MSMIGIHNPFSMASSLLTSANDTGGSFSPAVGFVSAGFSVILFGSNLVPVKKFETGDGIFFQWILCVGIWMVGLCVAAVRHFPKFYPLAMAGGAMWCTGNLGIVSIIKTIGLGQGILIWGSVNLISGWASSRLGLFGINKEIPHNVVFNYIGMCFCLTSAVCYLFIKTEAQTRVDTDSIEDDALLNDESLNTDSFDNSETPRAAFLERLNPRAKRIYGCAMSIFGGILFGLNFTPVIYVQDRYPGDPSKNGLDYVFAHFSGILLASTVFFIIYCILMKNRPAVFPQAILPGLASGALWGLGQTGWFIANSALSEPISFPIISTIPSIIGALWGVYFKEITGRNNYIVMAVAFVIAITGAVLTALSKLT